METMAKITVRSLLELHTGPVREALLALYDKVTQKWKPELLDKLLGAPPDVRDRFLTVSTLAMLLDVSGSMMAIMPDLTSDGRRSPFAGRPMIDGLVYGLNKSTEAVRANAAKGFGSEVLFHLMHKRSSYVRDLMKIDTDGRFPWLPVAKIPELPYSLLADGDTPIYKHIGVTILLVAARAKWHEEYFNRAVRRDVLLFTDGQPAAEQDSDWLTNTDIHDALKVLSPPKNPFIRVALLGLKGTGGSGYKLFAESIGVSEVVEAENADQLVNALRLWSSSRSQSRVSGARQGGPAPIAPIAPLPLADLVSQAPAPAIGFGGIGSGEDEMVELKFADPVDEPGQNIQLTLEADATPTGGAKADDEGGLKWAEEVNGDANAAAPSPPPTTPPTAPLQ